MARRVKELMSGEYEERFRDLKDSGCVLINYQGLDAEDTCALRASLREVDGEMMVVRNSLFRLALRRLGAEELEDMVDGPTAVVQAPSPVDAARTLKEAAEEHPTLGLRGGYAEGQLLSPEQVDTLAEIPGREALLSMLAGMLVAPVRRLAAGLMAKPRALVNGLNELREQKEAAE